MSKNQDLHVAYRPQDFEEVVGQDSIVDSLERMEKTKDWSHAYLMVGPSGTGKTTVGRIIAKKLKCEPSNLIEVDAASHSGVDHVRELTSGMAYKGFGLNPTKVIIIDECHSLSKQAWQALLKSIEEPPEHVYFILCTTEPDKVPKTIQTRCVVYNFRYVPRNEILDLLSAVADAEELKLEESAISLISTEADGSPRRALTLLAKCAACVTRKEVAEALESADETTEAIELCRALVKVKPALSWKRAMELVKGMENQNPESIRLLVVNYVAKVLMNTTKEGDAIRLLAILDAFSTPWNPSEKFGPLLLAIGTLVLIE